MNNGLILTINAGSSSLKFALFGGGDSEQRELEGKFERIGMKEGKRSIKNARGNNPEERAFPAKNHIVCAAFLEPMLKQRADVTEISAIAHRIVHGGPKYQQPQLIDGAMLKQLERIRSFDPDHLPAELALVDFFRKRHPKTPQIACFDTAFHSPMPRVAKLLPLPRRYEKEGVRRYGFHGLSYAYLMQELERVAGPDAVKGRVILAHLGNGASLAAVRDGQPIDTTMGFTPTAGLVMSTRSGDLDPGLVEYFARTERMSAAKFNQMINKKSGLLGISETSSDVRDLLKREKEDPRAADALAIFCYQARKWIGAFTAALGGLDTLVFSGGIGENSIPIRARICKGLGYLGIEIDDGRNSTNAEVISKEGTAVTVRVICTDEELQMARTVRTLLGSRRG